MTDRPPPTPADRRALWLKLGGVALVLLVLVGVGGALFGNSLGTPDEARRSRHPAGFSICVPLNWGATIYQRDSRGTDTIRITPDRSTGRQTILQATRLPGEPKLGKTAVPITFQGGPAYREIATTRYDWVWQVSFERDGAWYHVQITSPIELDPTNDPLVAFANSFRTETPVVLTPPPAPLPVPTTSPTGQP